MELRLTEPVNGVVKELSKLVEVESSGDTWVRYRTEQPHVTNPQVIEKLTAKKHQIVTLTEISRRQDISLSYLEQLFAKLRQRKLVSSVRGPGGGYRLARPEKEIHVAEIIDAVSESLDTTRCQGKGDCQMGETCLTHYLWQDLSDQIHNFLSNISLADLVARREIVMIARSQQDRAPGGVDFLDLFNDGIPLFPLGAVDGVWKVDSLEWPIGGDRDHVQIVDFDEFRSFGHGRTGHPRQLLVQLEEVLQSDRCQRLGFFLDLDPFFRFDGLMQTIAPLATFHHTAGMLIDDDDFAVSHDVIYIALVQMVSP